MDGHHYISVISNRDDGEGTQREVLRVFPESLRRCFEPIHSPSNNVAPLQQWVLKYSHTDVILKLRSADGPSIMLEGLSLIVDLGSVDFVAMPANITTRGTMGESSTKNEDRLKTFVCWLFPEIRLTNRYENHAISSERTEYYSQQRQRGRFRPQIVPVVHAEEMFSDEAESVG